jgi:hypothetical protein
MSNYLTSFWDENKKENFLRTHLETWVQDRPGFFTPFKSTSDFTETLIDPFLIPLTHGFISVFEAAACACATVVSLGSLLVGAAAWACGDSEISNSSLELAAMSSAMAGVWLLQSVIFAFSALLSFPVAAINLLTRIGASIDASHEESCSIGNCGTKSPC